MAKWFKIFPLILLLPQLIFTQSNVRFDQLSVEHGLSQNTIICMLEDSRGFMWFGTQNGLNRYDGKNFKVYKHVVGDSTSLSSNLVQDILEDENGDLWIATWGGGLNKFHTKTERFTRFRHDPNNRNSLSDDFLLTLSKDKKGYIWIGTTNCGIIKFDPHKGIFTHYAHDPKRSNSLSSIIVRAIYEDRNGIMWIGTSKGLNNFDPKTEKFICYRNDPNDPKSLSHDNVISIIEDDRGTLWVATYGGGLNKFDKSTKSFSHFRHKLNDASSLSHDAIQTMYRSTSEADVIWIATSGGGINKFDVRNEKFTRFMHDHTNPASLSTNMTTSVYEDISGLIWVGTAGQGICKYNKAQEKILHYKEQPDDPNNLFSNHLLGIYEDKDNRVWIGTDGFGLDMLDRQSGIFKHYEHLPADDNSLCSNTIYSIVEEKPGILWISTIDGLARLQVDKDMFLNFKHDPRNPGSISHNIVHQLYVDLSGILWIGTIGGGLNKLVLNNNQNPSEVFSCYMNDASDPYSISNNLVSVIVEDNDGYLWLGTVGGGLNKFDMDAEKFYHYQHDPNNPNSLSHNNINAIYIDSKDDIWVGTYGGGLNKFDSKAETFIHFFEIDGLANDIVYGMLEDDRGNLWISTKNGLSKFNPNDVDKWGKPLPGAFKNYYKSDGFQDNEFTYFSYFQNSRGELFFGGVNGLNIFHPDSLIKNPNIPDIVLTEFSVLNKPAELDSSITIINKITLPHNKNFFSFRFAALDLTTPEKNQYAYKLEGLEADWVYCGNFNFANYTAIKPGNYTFRVKGSNNDGIWNKEGTSIKITILPPWWSTNLAYSFYVLLFLSVVYGIWRFQINRLKMKHQLEIEHLHAEKLEEVDRMKSRFFANISHEFRTPLTLLQGPVRQIMSGEFRGNLKKQCEKILRYSNRLLDLISQILDLSKLESGRMNLRVTCTDVTQFLKSIVQSFASLAESKKMAIGFKTEFESISGYVDKDKLEKIVTNLLSNAFKFTPEGGNVDVNLSLRGDMAKTISMKQSLSFDGNEIASPDIHRVRKDSGNPGSIEISIFNSGAGIPTNELDKIFNRFYQVDESYAKDSEGSGIGLALTKELVEAHHGEIRVESELNKGTTFLVWLPIGRENFKAEEIVDELPKEKRILDIPLSPLDEVVDPSIMEVQESLPDEDVLADITVQEPVTKSQASKSAPLLLIVEDNPDVTSYISSFLEKDYRIITSENGKEGLKMTLDKFPDLIISDVMMPVMDGIELCRKLKSDERTSHIPVILLTAKVDMDSKIEGLEFGADDYVTKPFEARELHARVKNLIEQRKKLHEKFSRMIEVKPNEITTSSMDEEFLERLLNVFEDHVDESDFSTEDFAGEVGMSRSSLHRKLQALTNQPTHEFLRTLRLKRAAQLLKQSAGTITEIAYAVGFTNPSHFSKIFRQQFGQSPSEFASKNRGIVEQ